ncbi:hypothetical protein [Kocuria sp.]|nr:hypothetical protein [Kocuria sp.]MDO5618034.1 hypothetical protein [Kocuria sp.]
MSPIALVLVYVVAFVVFVGTIPGALAAAPFVYRALRAARAAFIEAVTR